MLKEICICAAWRAEDGTIARGHRHNWCRDVLIQMNKQPSRKLENQGFITSTNRFVDRYDGAKLQREAGITSVMYPGQEVGEMLFSEDLY